MDIGQNHPRANQPNNPCLRQAWSCLRFSLAQRPFMAVVARYTSRLDSDSGAVHPIDSGALGGHRGGRRHCHDGSGRGRFSKTRRLPCRGRGLPLRRQTLDLTLEAAPAASAATGRHGRRGGVSGRGGGQLRPVDEAARIAGPAIASLRQPRSGHRQ